MRGELTMEVIYKAFNEAWETLAPSCGDDDPEAIEVARRELAETILAVAHDESTNPKLLKSLALQMMRVRGKA